MKGMGGDVVFGIRRRKGREFRTANRIRGIGSTGRGGRARRRKGKIIISEI